VVPDREPVPALEQTREYRRAAALSDKGDDMGALRSLAYAWAGGLGDVILELESAEKDCREDARGRPAAARSVS
jgi:hypothetical protein